MQINYTSKLAYQGNNQLDLMVAKEKNGYKSDAWITFCQSRDAGLKLVNAKGKGVRVFKGFASFTDKETKDGKTTLKKHIGFLGYAIVFNMDLTEKFIPSV